MPLLCESATEECQTPSAEISDMDFFPMFQPQQTAKNVSLSRSTQSQIRQALSDKLNNISTEATLDEHGYCKLHIIAKTQHGELILAQSSDNKGSRKVAIKRTSKQLLKNKTTIDAEDNDNINTHILSDENIITEAILLNDATVNNTPPGDYVTKFIEFFQSTTDYYLVMEYVESQVTLKKFVEKAHQYIQRGILDRKEWNKILKFLSWQLVATTHYMHNELNIAHLDLTMENVMVKNGTFVLDEKESKIKINRGISIKICDFGLASRFKPGHYKCDKMPPQFALNYASPQMFNDVQYDARKADIWSLGIIIYKMVFNDNPYYIQSIHDVRYNLLLQNNLCEVMKMHKLPITVKLVDILMKMLQIDERERSDISKLLKHPWLTSYYQKYKDRVSQRNKKGNKE